MGGGKLNICKFLDFSKKNIVIIRIVDTFVAGIKHKQLRKEEAHDNTINLFNIKAGKD